MSKQAYVITLLLLVAVFNCAAQPDSVVKVTTVKGPDATTKTEFLENKIRFEQEKVSTDALTSATITVVQQNTDPAKPIPNENQQALITIQDQIKGYETLSQALISSQATTVPAGEPQTITDQPDITNITNEFGRNSKNKLYNKISTDSRIELRQLNPLIEWQLNILKHARSVGLIIRRSNIKLIADSLYLISSGITFGQRFNLCPGEAFAKQPIAGEGTGFLVANNEILTAAHVINGSITDYVLIFGFEILNKTGAYIPIVAKKDVYELAECTYRDFSIDILKIRLNRASERPILSLVEKPKINIGIEVYMLGYPAGLPLKAAINASISSTEKDGHFYTSLDAFQGNSGSPVIDLVSGEVIGILVAGTTDLSWNGSCNISTICNIPFCKGEKVCKIPTALLHMLHTSNPPNLRSR